MTGVIKKYLLLFFLMIITSPVLAGVFSASDFIGACPVYNTFGAVMSPAQYTVTYSCGTGAGGTVPTTTTATYNTNFTVATNTCTKSGYTFAGWRVSGTNDIKTSGVPFEWRYLENKTLTAVWLAEDWQSGTTRFVGACPVYNTFAAVFSLPVYTISYTMNGGTNYANAPTEYTAGTGATIDGTPTRMGYTFAGWCTDSGLTTCAMTQTISSEATGDKTFYAKWSQCSACAATNATCTFNGVVDNNCSYTTACETGYGNIQNNGAHNASCSPNSITVNWGDGESESCSYGEELTVPATPPTRRGYTFVGWTFE